MYDSIRGQCYAPQCNIHENTEVVYLLPEEIAALDLIDIQQLGQEEAALRLGISRKTIWRDLHEGRRKMADAIIHGKVIVMQECSKRGNGACPKLNLTLCPKTDGGVCPRPSDVFEHTDDPSSDV